MAFNTYFYAIIENDKTLLKSKLTKDLNASKCPTVISNGHLCLPGLYKVPVTCTICNSPEMIACFHKFVLKNSKSCELTSRQVKDNILISFARAMNFDTCVEELLKLYSKVSDEKVSTAMVVDEIFYLNAYSKIDLDTFLRLIKALYFVSLGVVKSEEFESKVLEAGIEMKTKPEKIASLFEIGFDINVSDRHGNTPLVLVCLNLSKCHFFVSPNYSITLVKLFLLENPSLIPSKKVTSSVLEYELRLYRHASSKQMSVEVFGSLQLIPMFHAHGYNFARSFEELKHQNSKRIYICSRGGGPRWIKRPEFPSQFTESLTALLETPRTLKEICRIVLRQHFYGRRILRFVSLTEMPETLKEHLLLKRLV